jgi:tetrahedral aminopeptidase
MLDRLVETAKKHEIPYQLDPIPGASGTDAWAIQVARQGVPTGLLGLPLRYMHTSSETLSLRDVERCGRLMAYFIAGLSEDFLATLTPALPEAE